jgi:hypothetical protein
MAQDRGKCWTFVNTAKNLAIPENVVNVFNYMQNLVSSSEGSS